MAVVELEILEPLHEAVFAGSNSVRMRGQVTSTGHGPLFFKWYSSLHVATGIDDAHMNLPADNPLDFTKSLGVGSHVISLAVKDVAGDTVSDLASVQDAGMAGGPTDSESPCIIHVFLAEMVEPPPAGPVPTLNKSGSTLEAIAPAKWGIESQTVPGAYEPDPNYLSVNRVAYLWRFEPLGNPPNRASAELVPAPESLVFDPGSDPSAPVVLQYQGALPQDLDTGDYTLILRVEDTQDAKVGHEVSRQIVIDP